MADETTRTPQTTGVEDVAVSMVKRVGMLVSSIAIQSLLAYALLPAGRGAYAVCILFAAWLGILLTPGADAGVQYFVVSKRVSVSEGVAVSLVICLIGTGIATALAIPLIHSGIPFFRKAEPGSFYLALVLVPLSTASNALQHQLAGLGRFARLALFTLMQTTANGVAAAVLVLGLRLGVNGALLAICVADLFIIILCLLDLRRTFGLVWQTPSRSAFGLVLRYGVKYHAARIGGNVDARIGVLLLGVLAARPEVGLFAVASGLMMRFIMISQAVASPLLPRTARGDAGRPELVAFCARTTIWVTAAALAPLVVFAVPVVRILLSADFLPIVPLLRIIAPGILLFAGANVLTSYFRVVNRPDLCSWAAAIGLAANALIVPLLYPSLGIYAAAWGMTAGLVLRSVLLSIFYYQATSTPASRTWIPQRADLARIASYAQAIIGPILSGSRRPGRDAK